VPLYQTTNCDTQFTNPVELVALQDDIKDIKIEEQNYDLFNKESIMMGILFITKKLKKMREEDSIQILEIVQFSLQTLLKYNTNEYMLEWYRKILEVLVTDQPDDVSILQSDQKIQFLVKLIQKVAQIAVEKANERKENPLSQVFVERVFELGLRYYEQQSNMMSDMTTRLFE